MPGKYGNCAKSSSRAYCQGNAWVSFRPILEPILSDTHVLTERLPSTRNAVSNGSRLHRRGIDGRTRDAKRFRDLFESFSQSLGGKERLSEADRALVRMAATLQVKSETMQAEVAAGGDVDAEQLVRISNSLSRVLGRLGKRQPKDTTPTIAEIAARHRAQRLAVE
jgi:hypothetical protein